MWKTLLNALEASNIVELQRIANCLKARLHGMWSMLKHTGMLDLLDSLFIQASPE